MGCLPFLLISSLLGFHHIDCIEIQGNRALDENSIIKVLSFTPPCSLSDSQIHSGIENVLLHYLHQGFLDVEITHHVKDGMLLLVVFEGTPYRLGDISFSGNRFMKDEFALRILGLRKGSIFSQERFEEGIKELLDFYGNHGFPFTSIAPVSFTPEESSIRIEISIEEGPRLRWGKIVVQGNTITKAYVIQRQMRIPYGEYFSETKLRTGHAWLGTLPFIEQKGELSLRKGEERGTVDVLVMVEEIKSNRVNGMLGYLPPADNEKGGAVGIIDTELLNLFGTGRSLRVSWEKQIPPYTKLDVAYTEPWILGTQAEIKLLFFHLLEDTLYTISRAAAEVKTDISLNLSLALVASWEKFTPATIALPSSKKYAVGTRFEIGTLDYVLNPRKGIFYSFYTEYGKKGSANIMKFSLEMLNVIPIVSNQATALLITGQASRTNTPPVPEYEQFPLGGYESLRGYRERQFRATQLLRISPEYRFLITRKSRLYVFYDAAFFETTTYPENVRTDHFRYGCGIGATFPAGIGVLSIEYALGEEKTFLKGKIHLGLESTF
jgi:outer membrane protein insertion porin family